MDDLEKFDNYMKRKIENYEKDRAASLYPQFYPPKSYIIKSGKNLRKRLELTLEKKAVLEHFNRTIKKNRRVIGTCTLFGKRVDIYDYQENLNSVLIKIHPNICNDFKDYTWQRYGVDNVEITPILNIDADPINADWIKHVPKEKDK